MTAIAPATDQSVLTRILGGRAGRSLALAVVLLLTALVYWPSLHGGYVFDDYANIVENRDVHLHTLSWEALHDAAFASPSSLLIRPLAMLSFGLDWYVGGGNPVEMKLVNLAIHLTNGLLLFALLRRIVRIAPARRQPRSREHSDLIALCITAAWLLAPINFTAVSYIVQRMESLSQLFVLSGLLGYVVARERMLSSDRGFFGATASIVLGTGIGCLAKESAALLPLYACALEWILFGFARTDGRTDRRLQALYVVILLVPGALAAVWALEHSLRPGAWVNRPFTLVERLLTEPRILLDYVRWSILPTADSLSLYHDNITVSRGLLTPITTLASIVGLAIAATAIPLLRSRSPLVALGIAWFLAAHLLTATVIPLELVFEHRNYFASIGLYLLVFPPLLPHEGSAMPFARATICAALLILFASVTGVRALDWSNPVEFALSEADKNPASPRTAYELGRTYVVLSNYRPDSAFVPLARDALEHAATMPGADTLADQGLLMLSGRMHEKPEAKVWVRFQNKLASQPLSAQNVSALYSLAQCAIVGDCQFAPERMVQSFIAALHHKPPDSRVLSIYANYAINVLHDSHLAVDLARANVQRVPHDLQARRNLMLLLETTGQHDAAVALYQQTLNEVPGAANSRTFLRWSEELLHPAQAAPPPPQKDVSS
jgi:hypothetical protein